MILRFERVWAAPPEQVWEYLTVPEKMNTWSEAKVSAIAPGEGGRHDGVGATRQVVVPAFGMTSRLEEQVVESDRPTRFVYRVIRGGGLRNHRGQIDITSIGAETRVSWEVSFGAPVPGMAAILGALLRPRLSRSLDALGMLLEHPG